MVVPFLLGNESLRRPSRARPAVELLSGGFRPRLISDAAAAAKKQTRSLKDACTLSVLTCLLATALTRGLATH
jgi:hypothetical protein